MYLYVYVCTLYIHTQQKDEEGDEEEARKPAGDPHSRALGFGLLGRSGDLVSG